jgi:cell wall-associated NlpC family hydrolase
MTFGAKVAAEARSWIDTPFKWGQSEKGHGCDCKGLIAGVARELARPEADSVYAMFANYRVDRPVPSRLLLEGFSTLFDRVDAMEPGDVLLLKHGSQAAHMAIYVGDERAVHAYPGLRSSVRERGLAVLFHKHPLHSIWRWKRLAKCR